MRTEEIKGKRGMILRNFQFLGISLTLGGGWQKNTWGGGGNFFAALPPPSFYLISEYAPDRV